MIRNVAGQSIGAGMVNAASGAAFAGTVTVYITGDAGVQTLGSVGSGICTNEGNGYYSYRPSQDETNYELIAFTFIGASAIPQTIQVETTSLAQAQAVQSATGPTVRYVLGVIANALFGLNVYAAGEPIKPADSTLCLFWLNLIFDDWNLDPQASYASPFTVFAATGVNPITIGPSGNWVLPARPPSIQGVAYDLGGSIYQNIYTTDDPRWWALQQSVLTGPPEGAYYEASEPNGKLYFNNIPAAATNIRLQLRTTFGQVALTDVLVLPPGYESALTLTLMESIAEPLNKNVSPALAARAGKARALIFSKNLRVSALSARNLGLPGFVGGTWDYRTGRFN